jgi:hypothetical protein
VGIEWEGVIRANAPRIAAAATARGAGEVVCILMDTAEARAGHMPAGVMQLILGTPLGGSFHLTDPSGAHHIACLPVRRDRLLHSLAGHRGVSAMPAELRDGGTPAHWAVCFEGDAIRWFDVPSLP